MRIFAFAALAVAALLINGCKSDKYYQASAAEKAREYLLEKSPELTSGQVAYVKYNDPVFLVSDVLGDNTLGSTGKTSSMQKQICVAWQIPGADKIYMVCGVSDSMMIFWSPNRLVRKNFNKVAMPQDSALKAARNYVASYLCNSLSAREMNQVLYLFPEISETNFEVNFNPEGKFSDKALADIKAGMAKQKQYSLIWGDNERKVVLTGYTGNDLSSWQVLFAGVLDSKEVNDHTVRVVNTPENFNSVIDTEPRK